jgi:uncharacterized glyoxalase superfamily protein PhnB
MKPEPAIKIVPVLSLRGAARASASYQAAFGAREPDGLRQGCVRDQFGHHWLIGRPIADG